MNPPPPEDARLESLLRRAMPPLADDGFSTRVLAALPATEPSRSWPRLAVGLAGAAAGIGVMFWQGLSWSGLRSSAGRLTAILEHTNSSLTTPWLGLALVVTALSLLAAFQRELRERIMP